VDENARDSAAPVMSRLRNVFRLRPEDDNTPDVNISGPMNVR